jgi:hypothetical protein
MSLQNVSFFFQTDKERATIRDSRRRGATPETWNFWNEEKAHQCLDGEQISTSVRPICQREASKGEKQVVSLDEGETINRFPPDTFNRRWNCCHHGSIVEATVIQWRQTETRRSNKVDWTNFTNKSQRVSKSAHWSTASRYDFLIDTSSSLDASVEVTSSLLSRGLSSLWWDSGLNTLLWAEW